MNPVTVPTGARLPSIEGTPDLLISRAPGGLTRGSSALPGLAVNPTLNPGGRILWLDRTRDHMRPVAWEKDLQAALPWAEPVCVADLTPAQAAEVFGSARAILGFHGAAFANMVFCPPGVKVAEIFIEPNHPWYARLAQSCGHEHTALTVEHSPSAISSLVPPLRNLLQP